MSYKGNNYKKIEDMVSSDPTKMYINKKDKSNKNTNYNMFDKIFKMFKYHSDDDSDKSDNDSNKIHINIGQSVRIINNYVDNDNNDNNDNNNNDDMSHIIDVIPLEPEIETYRLIEYPNEEFVTGNFHNNFNVNDYAFVSKKCSIKLNQNDKFAICTLSSMLLCGSFYFIINPL